MERMRLTLVEPQRGFEINASFLLISKRISAQNSFRHLILSQIISSGPPTSHWDKIIHRQMVTSETQAAENQQTTFRKNADPILTS